MHKVKIEGEKRGLFYGDRCDRYQPPEVQREKERRRSEIPSHQSLVFFAEGQGPVQYDPDDDNFGNR